MQVKTIVGHSLWEFLSEIQEAILNGYRLSDKSEYFPYSSGPLNIVHVVKDENEHSEEEASAAAQEFLPHGEGTPDVELGLGSSAAEEDKTGEVEYNPDLVSLSEVVNLEEQSGAAIPPVEKKRPGRKAKV